MRTMLAKLFLKLLLAGVGILALVAPELRMLSGPAQLLSLLAGFKITPLGALATLVVLLAVLPTVAVTATIIGFKRYIFSNYKSTRSSFVSISKIYVYSTIALFFLCALDFLNKLGILKSYYFELRLHAFHDMFRIYEPGCVVLLASLIHALYFVVGVFAVEFFVAFRLRSNAHSFLRKNKLLLSVIAVICSIYLGVIIGSIRSMLLFSEYRLRLGQITIIPLLFASLMGCAMSLAYWGYATNMIGDI
ncbi:hypothetical protein PAPHI01_0242 [Pancytospora philotis]|nr:hypothetical protein PAPHI01_0242 [Pancytospora philotis]